MPIKLSNASFNFGVAPSERHAPETEAPTRMNLLILGDFTGRANRGIVEPLTTRKLLATDIDTFARVFARLGVRLKLPGVESSASAAELTFATLEDFHPDKLLSRVPSLTSLTEARKLVLNPSTSEKGKATLEAILGAAITAPTGDTTSTTPSKRETDDDTMARLLGGTPPAKPAAQPASQVEQFIRQVVSPHVSSVPGAWQPGAVAAAEMELTKRLNAILHHPDFQAIEAAWRGADMLVRRIESSEEIGLHLLDASLAEIEADLAAHEQPEQSVLFRLLRDHRFSLLAGNYTFGENAEDLRALGKLAGIAAQLSAPFIATASPHLVGCDSFEKHPDPDDWRQKLPTDVAEVWDALRQSLQAHRVGLTAPRFIARQPYGKAGDPIDTFPAFEELAGEPSHASFLWGHSGILCACAAIDAIQSGDRDLTEFSGGRIEDLPVHRLTIEGEIVVKSHAEAWLTDRAVDRILSHGVLPILPVKNQNVIHLNHLRSIARERTALTFG